MTLVELTKMLNESIKDEEKGKKAQKKTALDAKEMKIRFEFAYNQLEMIFYEYANFNSRTLEAKFVYNVLRQLMFFEEYYLNTGEDAEVE